MILLIIMVYAAEPRHTESRIFVLCWKVVPISEVDGQASLLNPEVESIEGSGLQVVELATFMPEHSQNWLNERLMNFLDATR